MLAGGWPRISSSVDIIAHAEAYSPYLYRRNPAAARLCRWYWKTWLRHTQWRNLSGNRLHMLMVLGKDRDQLRPVVVELESALSVRKNRTTIMIKKCRTRTRKWSLKKVESPNIFAREERLTRGGRREMGLSMREARSQLFRREGDSI